MKQRTKEISAGVLLTVLLCAIFVFVHSRSVLNKPTGAFTLYASFKKADGIMNGAEVRVAGLKVGHVAAQKLNDQYGVRMTLSFDKPLELSTDSSASIETDGLLGAKYVELSPGGDDENLTNGGEIIYTQDALLLDELLEKVNDYMRAKKGEKNEKKSD